MSTQTQKASIALNSAISQFIYTVKHGDTLSKIIFNFYQVSTYDKRYKHIMQRVLFFNPQIKDPNRIYPNQSIRLILDSPDTQAICRPEESKSEEPDSLDYLKGMLQTDVNPPLTVQNAPYYDWIVGNMPQDPQEREVFRVMALLENNYNLVSNPPGIALGTFGHLTSQQNNAFLKKVEHLYRQYKSGILTQNQYNYQRRLALKEYAKLLGPFEKVLYKGQYAREAIRISRSKAIPANAKIAAQAQRLNRLAKISKHGGVMLMGAGLYVGCQQIKNASTVKEKNGILVETAFSTITGVGVGALVSIALASTPVGWGVALILSAGTAALGYDAGKIAKWVYDTNEEPIDFAGSTGVSSLCS